MTDALNVAGSRTPPPATSPPRTEKVEPAQPPDAKPVVAETHLSPTVHVDTLSGMAVLQFRDRDTGDVLDEHPNPESVRQMVERYEGRPAPVPSPATVAATASVAAQDPVAKDKDATSAKPAAGKKVELLA